MSLFGAMFAGVSGLRTQSQALGMIADNIANVNTVGFKETVSRFSTLVTEAATSTSFSPGGVQANPTQLVSKQGLLTSSASNTDIAIIGNGFFVVNESSTPGVGDEYLFTRAGSFRPDANGNLVNTSGHFLMGWPTDNLGVPSVGNLTALSSLQVVDISGIAGTAVSTNQMSMGANLPATAANGTAHSITMQLFDTLGIEHNINFTFTKAASNVWTLSVADPVRADTGVVSGTKAFADINVVFNGNGTLKGFQTDVAIVDGTITGTTLPNITVSAWTTGADDSVIAPTLGTANQADGMTQFASSFITYFLDQNGVRFGVFNSVTIGDDGIVTAIFDNGQTSPIFKVSLATFSNPDGLTSINGNVFRESAASGIALLNSAGGGTAGKIAASALESSTVDVATEFTNMIVTQRAFTAAARIITTADEMLEEVTRIAR